MYQSVWSLMRGHSSRTALLKINKKRETAPLVTIDLTKAGGIFLGIDLLLPHRLQRTRQSREHLS